MKFASILLLLFAFLNVTNVHAQRYDNDLKIGAGYMNYPSPKASTLAFYGEFSRPFFPKTIVGISAAAALPADYNSTLDERKLASYHFGLNLYFNLIDERKQNVKLGLGFSSGIFNTDWKVIDTGQTGSDHDFESGVAILMEYNLILDQRVILGIAAKGLLYGGDKNVFFGGLHAGFRF